MITTKTAKELYEISDYIDRLENRFHQAAGWNPKEVSFTLTVVEKKDHEPNYEVDIDLGGHIDLQRTLEFCINTLKTKLEKAQQKAIEELK